MPEVENWAEYGYPDDIMFRSPYLPWAGLVKALNERREAVELDPFPVPDYFTDFGGMYWESNFDWALSTAAALYVNLDKISTASRFEDRFWDRDDLDNAALDGEDRENVTSYSRPLYSAKWAIWTYNKINLLRYVATSEEKDLPVFTYIDLNSSFNFKAPGVS